MAQYKERKTSSVLSLLVLCFYALTSASGVAGEFGVNDCSSFLLENGVPEDKDYDDAYIRHLITEKKPNESCETVNSLTGKANTCRAIIRNLQLPVADCQSFVHAYQSDEPKDIDRSEIKTTHKYLICREKLYHSSDDPSSCKSLLQRLKLYDKMETSSELKSGVVQSIDLGEPTVSLEYYKVNRCRDILRADDMRYNGECTKSFEKYNLHSYELLDEVEIRRRIDEYKKSQSTENFSEEEKIEESRKLRVCLEVRETLRQLNLEVCQKKLEQVPVTKYLTDFDSIFMSLSSCGDRTRYETAMLAIELQTCQRVVEFAKPQKCITFFGDLGIGSPMQMSEAVLQRMIEDANAQTEDPARSANLLAASICKSVLRTYSASTTQPPMTSGTEKEEFHHSTNTAYLATGEDGVNIEKLSACSAMDYALSWAVGATVPVVMLISVVIAYNLCKGPSKPLPTAIPV